MTDKTITGALRRVELLLERQPEVEGADDVRMLCEEVKRRRAPELGAETMTVSTVRTDNAKPHGKCKVCGSALMRINEHWIGREIVICLPCEQKDKQELEAKRAYDAKVENWT